MAFSGALVSTLKIFSSTHGAALTGHKQPDLDRPKRLHHTVSSMHQARRDQKRTYRRGGGRSRFGS